MKTHCARLKRNYSTLFYRNLLLWGCGMAEKVACGAKGWGGCAAEIMTKVCYNVATTSASTIVTRPHHKCHAHVHLGLRSLLHQSGAIPWVSPFFRLLIVTHSPSPPLAPSNPQLHHQNGKPNKNHTAPAAPRPAPRRGHCLDGADAAATPAGKDGIGWIRHGQRGRRQRPCHAGGRVSILISYSLRSTTASL